jgi:RNA ligase (TIGR02306 family)
LGYEKQYLCLGRRGEEIMASDLIVPVVRLENVRPHPDAQKLDLADVLGFQVCIPKDKYKTGDVAVYFPADTLIPAEWADKFGVRQFLKGQDKDRVGRIRLRGEPSFGLVVDVPNIPPPDASVSIDTNISWAVGKNVAEFFSAKKYIPPIKATSGDVAAYDENIDPYFFKYTDIQNGRIFTDVLKDGEEVVATEKIHGGNCRVGLFGSVLVAGSHTTRKTMPPTEAEIAANLYWHPLSLKEIKALLIDAQKNAGTDRVILYGEIYGRVQSLRYGIPNSIAFRAFDLAVNGKYMDYDPFKDLCDKHGVEVAPLIYRGPYSMAKMKEIADGKSTIPGADCIREGVVVKPIQERTDPKIGRAILKVVGNEYALSKHMDLDTTDA